MPRARDRFGRAEQAIRWAAHNWPAGRRIEIEWKDILEDYDTGELDEKLMGQTYREGTSIVIELKAIGCRTCLLDTALHEYAHAVLWGLASAEFDLEPHPPSFWSLYGEIADRWHHDNGDEEADEY